MAEPELPPKIAKIALVLTAILFISTLVGMGIYLNGLEASPTNQPTTESTAPQPTPAPQANP